MYSKITKGRVLVAASTYKGGDADYYCDGHADERFINAAIQYLSENFSGGIVTLTEGDYYLTARINLDYSNIILQGYGAQTVLHNSVTGFHVIACLGASGSEINNVIIRNLKITQDVSSVHALIIMYYADNWTISNCFLDNPYYYGIMVSQCDGGIISDNYFTRQSVEAIQVWDANSGIITGNNITGGGQRHDTDYIIDIFRCNKYMVADNIIHDFSACSDAFYAIRVYNDGAANNSIHDNTIYDLENTYGDMCGIYNWWASGNKIQGNLITSLTSYGGSAWAIGIEINSYSRNEVVNNRVESVQNIASAAYGQGLSIDQIAGTTYDNIANSNLIYNCSGYGVYIGASVNRTIVAANKAVDNGNLISRWGCDSSTTSPALLAEASCTIVNGTWGFTSTNPYSGVGQWRFTAADLAGSYGRVHFIQDPGPGVMGGVTANAHYRFSAYLNTYSSASGLVSLQLYQVTVGGGETTVTTWTSATSGWQLITVSATVYASATMFALYIQASASMGTGDYFDVNNVRFHETGIANNYGRNFYDAGTDTASINSWA